MRIQIFWFNLVCILLFANCNNPAYELKIDGGSAFRHSEIWWDNFTDDSGFELSKMIISSNIPVEDLVFDGDIISSQEVVGRKINIYFKPLVGETITVNSEGCSPLYISIPVGIKKDASCYNVHIWRLQPSVSDSVMVENVVDKSFTETIGDVEFDMVFVQGGTFMMGSTEEQNDGGVVLSDGGALPNYEKPLHPVTLSDYYIGKYEVTQKLWKAIMGNNSSYFEGDDLPMERVSWNDVAVFIDLLNKKTGKKYRLPTEAEWEYAARGGSKSQNYSFCGGNDVNSLAWHYDNSEGKTHPVGQLTPNELGLYDMGGNVWEWCNDWFAPYNSNHVTNPRGPANGEYKIFRGGSFYYFLWDCRAAARNGAIPGEAQVYVGFRLAL